MKINIIFFKPTIGNSYYGILTDLSSSLIFCHDIIKGNNKTNHLLNLIMNRDPYFITTGLYSDSIIKTYYNININNKKFISWVKLKLQEIDFLYEGRIRNTT